MLDYWMLFSPHGDYLISDLLLALVLFPSFAHPSRDSQDKLPSVPSTTAPPAYSSSTSCSTWKSNKELTKGFVVMLKKQFVLPHPHPALYLKQRC